MANMSHCRFENTADDLRDCNRAMNETLGDEWLDELSESERRAAIRLIKLCVQIADHSGHLADTR